MKRLLGALACPVALAACGGGSSGGSAVPTISPPTTAPTTSAPLPTSTLPPSVVLTQGSVNGAAGYFIPPQGDTASGGNGAPVDGITCDSQMYDTYHVHVYLGVIVNGSWLADPTAIGMVDPGPAQNGFVDTASCFYWIHTHDSSGYIHLESPSAAPVTSSEFTLGNVMDIWGQTLTSTQFGPWSGNVRIFTGTAPAPAQTVTSYTEYTGSPAALPLYSHEAIWLEVNAPYTTAASLPPVTFTTEY
jgi:hypothetical protein